MLSFAESRFYINAYLNCLWCLFLIIFDCNYHWQIILDGQKFFVDDEQECKTRFE